MKRSILQRKKFFSSILDGCAHWEKMFYRSCNETMGLAQSGTLMGTLWQRLKVDFQLHQITLLNYPLKVYSITEELLRNHHWHQQSDPQQQWSLRRLAISIWYKKYNMVTLPAKPKLPVLASCLQTCTSEAEGRRMNIVLYWTIQSGPSGEQPRLPYQGWRERTIMEENMRESKAASHMSTATSLSRSQSPQWQGFNKMSYK